MTHPILPQDDTRSDPRADSQTDERLERQQALWALNQLAANTQDSAENESESESESASPTVSDAEIAALLDGRLSPEARERVLAALEADDEAATVWLTAAAALEQEAAAQDMPQRAIHQPGRTWFRTPFRKPRKPRVWAMAASIAIASFLATQAFMPDVPGRIDRDLRQAAAAGWQPPATLASAYGFSAGRPLASDPVTQAIQAGYRAAATQLDTLAAATSRSAPALASTLREPAAAYHAGRWLALLEAAASAPAIPSQADFWSAQPRIGRRLTDQLPAQPASASARPELERLVQQLDAGAPAFDARWQQAMQRDLMRARLELDLPAR